MVVKKLLWPTLKQYWRLFLAMTITSALGIAIMIGLWGVYSNLKTGVNGFIEDYDLADAVIQTSLSTKDLSALESKDSIECYNTRLVLDCTMLYGEEKLTARVFTYSENDFQKFHILETKKSEDLPNIRIASNYAKRNNISVGDELNMYYYNTNITVCVGEIVTTPECMSVKQNRFLNAETSGFGFIFIDEKLTESINIFHFYNQILLKTKEGYTNKEMLEDAKAALPSNLKVLDSYTYEESNVGVSIRMNLTQLKSLFTIVPPLFFGITLLIVFLFMVQIMKQERKNAGILKALGYESKDILALYLVIGAIVSIIAGGIGIALGYPLEFYINRIYLNNFGVPYFNAKLDVGIAILAMLANVFVCLLGAFISAKGVFEVEPIEAMSTQVSASREPIPEFLRGLPTALKISISMIVRNQKRFILSTVCVMLSVMMILAGLMFYNSGNEIKNQTFQERFVSDAMVLYSSKITDKQKSDIEKQEFITAYEVFQVSVTEISYLGESTSITLFGLTDTKLHQIPDSSGLSTMEIPKNGIVLTKYIAKAIGAKKGDVIRLNGKPIEVTDISYEYVSALCYMGIDEFQNYGLTSMGGFFCNTTDKTQLVEYTAKMSNYSSICFTSQMKEFVYHNFEIIYLGVYIIIGFAIILGFVIISNVSQITLSEEKRELAVMRTIGVRMSYISSSWGIEAMLQYVLSCGIGAFMGLGISYFVLNRMSSMTYVYPCIPKGSIIILTMGIVFTFVMLNHFVTMYMIRRLDLVECTKSKE